MLRIALCQFPVGRDVTRNAAYIEEQLREAAGHNAHIALFPECALGGYAGFDFPGFHGYDWETTEHHTRRVMTLARELGLWVVLGSNHRLGNGHKPHNCLYLISDRGLIVDRYDKMFCMGAEGELDLAHYTPGTGRVSFALRGVTCGLLICHDWRYPEIYRRYTRDDIRVILQSWYDGALDEETYEVSGRDLGHVIRATVQGHAACNALWICGTNTSAPESCFGGFVVRPDGVIDAAAPRNEPFVLVYDIDPRRAFDDPTKPWRKRAMDGVLHSGTPVSDPRSDDRTCL